LKLFFKGALQREKERKDVFTKKTKKEKRENSYDF